MAAPAQVLLEEGIGVPILIGRPGIIETRLKRFGLRIRPGRQTVDVINPRRIRGFASMFDEYFSHCGRRAVIPGSRPAP